MKNPIIHASKSGLLLVFLLLSSQLSFGQNWTEIVRLSAADKAGGDRFGYSIAMSGDYAIIGAYDEDEDVNGMNKKTSAGSAYILKNNAGVWTQVQKIVASDRTALDEFGSSVAISGNYAIVGAPYADRDAAGNNPLADAGAAYIFINTNGTWTEVQKVVPSDRSIRAYFGNAVAIAGDYALIGTISDEIGTGGTLVPFAGAAYFFNRQGSLWQQSNKVVVTNDSESVLFARNFALTPDFAIIGAYYDSWDASGNNILDEAGAAYVYKNVGGNWEFSQKLVAEDRRELAFFGLDIAMQGDYALVGSVWASSYAGGDTIGSCGAVYVFKLDADNWRQVQKLAASDPLNGADFGNSIGISGDYAVIGAFRHRPDLTAEYGAAYVYKIRNGTWFENARLVATDKAGGDAFGISVAISGSYVMSGASGKDVAVPGASTLFDAGAVYIYSTNSSVGIIENSFGETLRMYPNPTAGNFSVDLAAKYESVEVQLADLNGKLIQSGFFKEVQVIDLSIAAPDGIYLLRVKSGDKQVTIRMLKEKK